MDAPTRAAGFHVVAEPEELPTGSFDVVLVHHVLEHVSRFDELFPQMMRVIVPGGLLVIAVPNAASLRARLALPALSQRAITDERYLAYPIHLSHFSPRSLTQLVQSRGFESLQLTTYGFGIQDLFKKASASDFEPKPASSSPAVPSGAHPLQSLKNGLKRLFFGALWGENLLLAARRPHAAA
jgi:SAM-dependent methyltransferase